MSQRVTLSSEGPLCRREIRSGLGSLCVQHRRTRVIPKPLPPSPVGVLPVTPARAVTGAWRPHRARASFGWKFSDEGSARLPRCEGVSGRRGWVRREPLPRPWPLSPTGEQGTALSGPASRGDRREPWGDAEGEPARGAPRGQGRMLGRFSADVGAAGAPLASPRRLEEGWGRGRAQPEAAAGLGQGPFQAREAVRGLGAD